MGFIPEPTVYRLTFDDARLADFEVYAKSVSIGEFMEITGMSAAQVLGGVTYKPGAIVTDPLLSQFAGVVTDWNLESKDGPVGVSATALASLEPWIVNALVRAWMEAVSGGPPNPGGDPGSPPGPAEAGLPMDAPPS